MELTEAIAIMESILPGGAADTDDDMTERLSTSERLALEALVRFARERIAFVPINIQWGIAPSADAKLYPEPSHDVAFTDTDGSKRTITVEEQRVAWRNLMTVSGASMEALSSAIKEAEADGWLVIRDVIRDSYGAPFKQLMGVPFTQPLATELNVKPPPAASEMTYAAFEDRDVPDQWRVEAIGSDGEGYVTIFCGTDAELRAREYAAWKNGGR